MPAVFESPRDLHVCIAYRGSGFRVHATTGRVRQMHDNATLVVVSGCGSADLYVSLNHMGDPKYLDFERHLCLETFIALEAPGIGCLSDSLLDLSCAVMPTIF